MEVAEELGVDALVETKADDVEWLLHRALLLTLSLLFLSPTTPPPPPPDTGEEKGAVVVLAWRSYSGFIIQRGVRGYATAAYQSESRPPLFE